MTFRFALATGLIVSTLLVAVGCNSEGLGGTQVMPECSSGQTRCVGNTFQQCGADSTFTNALTCSQTTQCSDSLGCVACLPNTNTCDSGGTEIHSCNADGTVGALQQACPFGQICSSGACIDSCELAASEYVYLVDTSNNFMSYEPRYDTNPASLKTIGKLTCSTTGATPFSMGVDRKARAWVLYNDGNIYFVSPADASCKPSGYTKNQGGFNTFGMGFVADTLGSKTETLYVANANGSRGLAKVDPGTMLLTSLATFPNVSTNSPEMSGTGAANLYGYFPSATAGSHFISQIDKLSGAFTVTWQLPALPGAPNAWAFAHWGGRYYQFVTSAGKNQIRRYDPATQQNVIVLDNLPTAIVGAGVSTCAPYISG